MDYKKITIISILLLIFSVSAVSAMDFDDFQTNDMQHSEETVTQDSLQHDVAESTQQSTTLKEDFDDLQVLIFAAADGSTINLNRDYVGNKNPINIDKNIVINGNGHILNANGESNIFSLNGPVSVTLKDFTFVNGKCDNGGAICSESESSSLTLIDCNFQSNVAGDYGGAVYTKGNLNVEGCTFTLNSAKDHDGGAIYFGGPRFAIENSTFDNNFADENGGAIYCDGIRAFSTIKNCKFKFNLADDACGGAVYSRNHLSVENSVFENNSANNKGGAIYSNNDVTANNCSFYGNVANGDFFIQCCGGAIFSEEDVYISRSVFVENRAHDYGGAIYAKNVNINVEQKNNQTFNSLFHSNWVVSNDGGAIYSKINVNAINTEFNSNYADDDGGAIFSCNKVNVDHCLFEYNDYIIVEDYDIYHDLRIGGSGGAIYSKDEVIINNSTFLQNYALNDGGAVYAKTVSLRNTPSYFISNYALKRNGGAIYTDKFNNNVKYSVFDGNRAGDYYSLDTFSFGADGGSIYINSENDIEFSSCLFMNSHATDEGGVIYLDSTSSKLSLIDNIFINNEANGDGKVVFNKGEYNTIMNNWWGNDAVAFKNILVEWNALSSNEDHFDENPLGVRLILGSTNAGIDSRIPYGVFFVSLLDGSTNHNLFDLDYFHFVTNRHNGGKFINYTYRSNGFDAFYIPNCLGIHEIYDNCYEYDEKLSGYINVVDNSSNQDNKSQIIQSNTLYFSYFQNMVNNAPDGSVINLNNNFVFSELNDNEGIIINKNLVIDGHGHSFDAKSLSGIFQSSQGSVTLKNIVFKNGNQKSADDGGAIRILGSARYTIYNCTFDSNKALQDGGAIYNEGGNLELNDCTFINNCAEGANKLNDCDGGAVHSKAPLLINHCDFKNNYAADNGGAIYATNGITWVSTPSNFEGNTAYKGKGGAVYTNIFNNNVRYAVFFNNHAGEGATISDDGGAIYINKANTVTFSQCAFIINHCSDEGGAIYLDSTDSHLTLKNNFFLGNTAGDEGQVVFNKGHYDAVTDNWWADNLPSNDNDLLIEWEPIWANDHRTDSNPVYMKLKLDSKDCNVGNSVWATVCFYHHADGSLCNGEMFTELVSFLPNENVDFYNRMGNDFYINILVLPQKSGTYTITANLYGQFASDTLYAHDSLHLENSNISYNNPNPVSDDNFDSVLVDNYYDNVFVDFNYYNYVFVKNVFGDNIVSYLSGDNDTSITNQSNSDSQVKSISQAKTILNNNNLYFVLLLVLIVALSGFLIIRKMKK